jgi:hypothetical protein
LTTFLLEDPVCIDLAFHDILVGWSVGVEAAFLSSGAHGLELSCGDQRFHLVGDLASPLASLVYA